MSAKLNLDTVNNLKNKVLLSFEAISEKGSFSSKSEKRGFICELGMARHPVQCLIIKTLENSNISEDEIEDNFGCDSWEYYNLEKFSSYNIDHLIKILNNYVEIFKFYNSLPIIKNSKKIEEHPYYKEVHAYIKDKMNNVEVGKTLSINLNEVLSTVTQNITVKSHWVDRSDCKYNYLRNFYYIDGNLTSLNKILKISN